MTFHDKTHASLCVCGEPSRARMHDRRTSRPCAADNADGLDDMLIGAYGNSDVGEGAGAAYLVVGAAL